MENFGLTKPLILWINDGFDGSFSFFLNWFGIKRELLIGGIICNEGTFPILLQLGHVNSSCIGFLILMNNPKTSSGMGIPMATDIAFSSCHFNLF